MGQVWLAEQTEPVRRRVALKLTKAGMYDASVIQRFQAERQSLAIMDHPAIAKVFDAGATPAGQPYLVMEYVDGLPITDYCDRKKLGIRERLEASKARRLTATKRTLIVEGARFFCSGKNP
jgi:non-specific serine/threonine protein kinase/serine/threonine-protein kinase